VPALAYNISTTAAFEGPVTVSIEWPGISFLRPATLRMFHFEGGWTDVTMSLDVAAHTISGVVQALSPFVVVESINRAPVADAGVDQTYEMTAPAGVTAMLDGTRSADPDGDPLAFTWSGPFGTATGASVSVSLPLGAHTVTLTVDDGMGASATDTVVVTVQDTVPPSIRIDIPANATYELNQVVTASYSCVDSGSGIASCTGPVPPGAAIDTSREGIHGFAVAAEDQARNSASSTVSYAVTGLEGRMAGAGRIRESGGRDHHFVFWLAERHLGLERGRLTYQVRTPKSGKQKARTDRFEATSIGPIAFWNDPAYTSGRGQAPAVDSVVFSGEGRWNGASGYTFEARAADEGEPGRGRDTFAITIRHANGSVVAALAAVLTEGNIQSERLRWWNGDGRRQRPRP
jgi:hypothetical protein